jgi:hypothetical protein
MHLVTALFNMSSDAFEMTLHECFCEGIIVTRDSVNRGIIYVIVSRHRVTACANLQLEQQRRHLDLDNRERIDHLLVLELVHALQAKNETQTM